MSTTSAPIHIETRSAWDCNRLLFLVGPGAAGKSTLSLSLAPLLGRALVDLDEVFLARVGDIGAFIREAGYETYKRTNSSLAKALAADVATPTIIVTSSGFLTIDNPPDVLAANRSLLGAGYAISLLPALDVAVAVEILVARQMTRPFNAGPANEAATARGRFDAYQSAGDLLVASTAHPDIIAAHLAAHLVCGPQPK